MPRARSAVLNKRREYADDLEPALRFNNVDRTTLDAMTDAVVASLPSFRGYLRTKARVLGHDEGLPWWDLFAPLGDAGEVAWSQASALVRAAFDGYSPQLAALADRAFSESWVDAEIRDGKRGGAYCMSVGDDVSRVMMNFDGSHDSVATLAHELGHAYHNVALADRTPIQRATPMALAETASIFCETLLFETALTHTTDPTERLALLDTYLVGATQVVVDIHSRFLFESELCRRRQRTALSVSELCATMLDAQERAYGDGLHPEHRHAYMWAVKPHYFTPFYNWPYTFGLLFGIGLHARYLDDPAGFRNGYDLLLSTTGMADAAALTARFGVDVHDGAFWAASLDVVRGHIDEHAAPSDRRSAVAPHARGNRHGTAAGLTFRAPRPDELGHTLMVDVEDVDRHYERAVRSGAEILIPVETYVFGERQYSARDLGRSRVGVHPVGCRRRSRRLGRAPRVMTGKDRRASTPSRSLGATLVGPPGT